MEVFDSFGREQGRISLQTIVVFFMCNHISAICFGPWPFWYADVRDTSSVEMFTMCAVYVQMLPLFCGYATDSLWTDSLSVQTLFMQAASAKMPDWQLDRHRCFGLMWLNWSTFATTMPKPCLRTPLIKSEAHSICTLWARHDNGKVCSGISLPLVLLPLYQSCTIVSDRLSRWCYISYFCSGSGEAFSNSLSREYFRAYSLHFQFQVTKWPEYWWASWKGIWDCE